MSSELPVSVRSPLPWILTNSYRTESSVWSALKITVPLNSTAPVTRNNASEKSNTPLKSWTAPAPVNSVPEAKSKPPLNRSLVPAGTSIEVVVDPPPFRLSSPSSKMMLPVFCSSTGKKISDVPEPDLVMVPSLMINSAAAPCVATSAASIKLNSPPT